MSFEISDILPGGEGGKDGGLSIWWLVGGGVLIVGYLIFFGGRGKESEGSVNVSGYPGRAPARPTNGPPGVTKAQLASFRDNITNAFGELYQKISKERKAALEETVGSVTENFQEARAEQSETFTDQLEKLTGQFTQQFDNYQDNLKKQFSNIAGEFESIQQSRTSWAENITDQFTQQFEDLRDQFENINSRADSEPVHHKDPQPKPQPKPKGGGGIKALLSRKRYATPRGGWDPNSVVDFLKSNSYNASFGSRKKIAKEIGIHNYRGTARQNNRLLGELKDVI